MSAINKFATEEEYNAHTKSTDNSEISLVGIDDIHYDGLNYENTSGVPAIGDCLYLDSNNQRHFFYGATVNNSILTANGYTPVGVVVHKYENSKVLLMHVMKKSKRYCNAFIRMLSDYKIDGTANDIQVQYYNSNSITPVVIANHFTESCSSLQDFVTKFDTFLRANQVSAYDWHCELMNVDGTDEACVVIDKYTYTYQYMDIIKSGCSSTPINFILAGINTNYSLLRNNGVLSSRIGVNKEYVMQKYSTTESTTSDATDSITNANGIINKSDFDNNLYPTVKAYYVTYDKYIDSIMMQTKPCSRGGQVTAEDGETITRRLKEITYTDIDGNTKYLFSAIKACSDEMNVTGFDFHLTDVNEFYDIFSKIDLINFSDPIQVALKNINNTSLAFLVSYWISNCKKSNNENIFCRNANGCLQSANLCNAYNCIPVTVLK